MGTVRREQQCNGCCRVLPIRITLNHPAVAVGSRCPECSPECAADALVDLESQNVRARSPRLLAGAV